MNRLVAFFLISLLVCLDVCVVAAEEGELDARIRVGVIVPFTGELSPFGEALRQGIELAQGEGHTQALTFFLEDDRSGNRAVTVGALQRLIEREHIQALMVTAITNLIPIDQIVRREGILALSAIDSNKMIESLAPSSFGYGWSNELTGEEMGRFACETIKARTIAVVVGHDEWSELIAAAFSKAFRACGGQITNQESVDLSATDFRSLSARISRMHPEGVYLPLYGPALVPFVRQLKQAGYRGTLLSAEGITQGEVRQLGELAEGMYVTSAHLSDASFEERYRTRFKLSHVELNLAHVALGYEIARFLDLCARQLRERKLQPTNPNLLTVFRSLEHSDIFGPVSFRAGKSLSRGQVVLAVKGGKLVPVRDLPPSE